MELSDQAKSFFLCAYLGILPEDRPEEQALKCAKRAYQDLKRTLRFAEPQADHRPFVSKISNLIVNGGSCHGTSSEGVLFCLTDPEKSEHFDDWHQKLCEAIIKEAESSGVLKPQADGGAHFFHGQAQKWLNMTLKYMLLLDTWADQFQSVLHLLHAPVDSGTIEAAQTGLLLPKDKPIRTVGKPWSRWELGEYQLFQADLREACTDTVPILWESTVWIEMAKRRMAE